MRHEEIVARFSFARDLVRGRQLAQAGGVIRDLLKSGAYCTDPEAVATVISEGQGQPATLELLDLMRAQQPSWALGHLFAADRHFPKYTGKSVIEGGELICEGGDPAEFLRAPFADGQHPISKAIPWMAKSPPVRLVRVRNALLHLYHGGFIVFDAQGDALDLYCNYLHEPYLNKARALPAFDIERGAFVGDLFGSNNFCHFLVDYLPRQCILERYCPEHTQLLLDDGSPFFQAETLPFFGLSSNMVAKLKPGNYRIRDFAMLSSSTHQYSHVFHGSSRTYFDLMIRNFRERRPTIASVGRRIYITRPISLGRRALLNEERVVSTLTSLGFQAFDPGAHSVSEQINAFSEADFVVGIHGAALSNLIYTPANARVIEFLPPNAGSPAFARVAGLAGQEYHCIMGANASIESPLKTERDRADFSIDLPQLIDAVQG